MALVGNISGSGGVNNTIGITGSLIIANPGTAAFPTFPGADVALFVSGNIASKPATSPDLSVRGTTVFGGDVVISGTLFGGSPLHIGTFLSASQGAEIGGVVTFTSTTAPKFNNGLSGSLTKLADGTSYLVAGSNVTISTGSNGAITISSAGGGGGGGESVFTAANSSEAYTTSSIAIGTAATADANGADVFFFVSGSTDGTKSALFGGDVVTSGSVTVRDNTSAISIGYGPSTGVGQITSLNGNLVLDTVGGSRVIVDTDLEVAGTNIYAGGGGGARNIFTDNDTPAKLITIGGVGGKTTVAGGLEVTGNYISGSAGVNLTLGSSGDVTVAGDLAVNGPTSADITTTTATATVFNTTATNISFAGAATTLTIGATSGNTTVRNNLTVTGDLTVNGTTTTIDTTNLLVEDPIIYFGSGSVGVNRNGGIALASGSSVANQALVWGRVDTNTWGAGRKDVTNGTETDLTTMVLQPVRASKFEVGGATAFVTSALGSEITVKTTVGDVNLDAASGASVDILFNGTQAGAFSGTGASSLNLFARDAGPATTARALTLSGSSVTIGSHGSTTNFAFAGSNVGAASSVGGFTVGANPGLNLSLSGSQILINSARGTTSAGATFQADGANILAVQSGTISGQLIIAPGPSMTRTDIINTDSTTVNFAGAATALTMGAVGTATTTIRGGTLVGNVSTQNIFNTTATTVNFVGAGTDISVGASGAGSLYLKNAVSNISGSLTVAGVIEANNGTVTTNQATFNLINTTATTVNFAGAGTNINIGSTAGGSNLYLKSATTNVSGSIIIAGSTTLGDATGDDITFTGRAASSLVPKTNNLYDLGTPDLRWRNMYTGDLHLRNERGDWTIIEERDYLTITNNHSGKRYKFMLQEI